jgi:hypothetical protein
MARTARIAVALAGLLMLLAACTPAGSGERNRPDQIVGAISYYPQQAGVIWQYLPEGALLGEPRLFSAIEGPTVLDGEIWIGWRMIGLGFDTGYLRQYRSDGVFLRRKTQPGTIFTFDPPIREFPAPETLRVGASWSGETTVTALFPEAPADSQTAVTEVAYVYTVVDQRTVTLVAGEFDVFIINFVTRTLDDDGGIADELVQEVWFAPFVGEVRTENGYFLIDANFLDAPPEEEQPAGDGG